MDQMNNWNTFRERIKSMKATLISEISFQKHLLIVANSLETMEIDPTNAENASMSNLRNVLRNIKRAIQERDRQRLEELLHMAATMTCGDLRIKMETRHRPEIFVSSIEGSVTNLYSIVLTKEQAEQLARTMKQQFEFIFEEVENEY